MTTETKSETTTTPAGNDNRAVFGPLGKYAMVAVIMVSVIVTTAIMLDRQLKSVDEQIAAIEEEVADMHTAAIEVSPPEENIAETAVKEEATVETVATVATPAVAEPAAPAVTEETAAEVVEAATAEAQPVPQIAAAPETTENTVSATATQFEMANTENAAQARHEQLAKENQARIEAYKLEQKKHMTDMFARIKTLESQQLGRYKTSQNSQIARLRKQITQQQEMIEALVIRNKDLFDMRAAAMQHNQDKREQVLNRI